MQRSVLIVDDDRNLGSSIRRHLERAGITVRLAYNIAEARLLLEKERSELALVDYHLPDGPGADLIRWALARGTVEVAYCMTGAAQCANVVDVMRAGAKDVLEKPFPFEAIEDLLKKHAKNTDFRGQYAPNIMGDDPELLAQLSIVESVADTDSTVLVLGESGTGKELIARALHDASLRREGPFVALNCAAIPESLIEDELFGHAKGAFTGALTARDGRIASANKGTLFLDEIGDMPLVAQAKLLRVLQEKQVNPIGDDRAIALDIRVVAATNRDLEQMVEAGTFRADLLFRLSVITVELPALRERGEDVLALAHHFLALANRRTGRNVQGFDEQAQAALLSHSWPGNVRELANAVERAVVMKRSGLVSTTDLKIRSKKSAPAPVAERTAVETPSSHDLHLKSALDGVEKKMIAAALERSNGNRTEAAALLGLNRTTLVEKMKRVAG